MSKNFTLSDFYCTECGKRGIPIARKKGQQREAGHLKKIFCLYCNCKTNHAEVKPFGAYTYDDFLEEYSLGRFVNGNKIPIAKLESCSQVDCDYNKHGKCWNSKNNVNCVNRVQNYTNGLERDRR